jgi:hypothetical protein
MSVSVTKNLSPQMQLVSDQREAVKLAEAEVDRLKTELKTAKAVWEEAVAAMNSALDDLIEKEKEPTLFDDLSDEPRAATEVPPGGPGGGSGGAGASGEAGEVVDAEHSSALVPTGQHATSPDVQPVPLSLPAAVPTWRRMTLDSAFETEVDISTEVIEALKAAGVETCGVLAAKLAEGETFGLRLIDVQALCESIEMMSEDDEQPVKFSSDDEEDEDGEDAGTDPDAHLKDERGRYLSSAMHWEKLYAAHPGVYDGTEHDRRRVKIADFRARQAAADGGHAQPKWGLWSEFSVSLASGDVVRVAYEPDHAYLVEHQNDHFEFFGDAISSTGYRSHFETWTKARPKSIPLVEWAREFAETLYTARQTELKKEAGRKGGVKGKPTDEKPAAKRGKTKGKKSGRRWQHDLPHHRQREASRHGYPFTRFADPHVRRRPVRDGELRHDPPAVRRDADGEQPDRNPDRQRNHCDPRRIADQGKGGDSMNIADIITMLKRLEDRMFAAAPVDNLRFQGLHMQLHTDGSGAVIADWARSIGDDVKEVRLLNTIMSDEDELFMFKTPEELHGELVARTMAAHGGGAAA